MHFVSAQTCSGSPHIFISASQEGFLSGALVCAQYFCRLPTLFDAFFSIRGPFDEFATSPKFTDTHLTEKGSPKISYKSGI